MIFSSFFPYYSSKPLHEPSGGNHGLDLRCRSLSSPSAADLHHHPAPYLSLLCAKRSICARGSSNRYRSSVGMFLDFFYGSKMRKAKKKKKIWSLQRRIEKEKFVSWFFYILYFFMGLRWERQEEKKRKEKKERMNWECVWRRELLQKVGWCDFALTVGPMLWV